MKKTSEFLIDEYWNLLYKNKIKKLLFEIELLVPIIKKGFEEFKNDPDQDEEWSIWIDTNAFDNKLQKPIKLSLIIDNLENISYQIYENEY